MDKQVLGEYIHACALAEEVEQELKSLEKKKAPAILGKVKGSNPNFPYQECSFTISGSEYGYEDDRKEHRKREVLKERMDKANEVKVQVEEWMNTIPMRMQRIIKYRFFLLMAWEAVSIKVDEKTTGESVRKEFERFFREK